MSRPWRIQYRDAVYHIMSRGNNQQDIFLNDQDRRDFLILLGRCSERFNLDFFCFCLMSNHYHLFVRTREANLAQAFMWLNATYTLHFHRRHKSNGHLFQGRYKSVLVASDAHWQHLSFYLHLNPVRAGLVSDPEDYQWSSCLDYVRARPRFAWLKREEILSQYRASGARSRFWYRRHCRELIGKQPEFWEDLMDQVIIGSREMVQDFTKRFAPRGKEKDVADFRKSARSVIEVDPEMARVARAFKVTASELKSRKRNFPAKFAAYYHLVEHCGLSASAVASLMKVSPMAVSMGIKKLNQQIVDHPTLKKLISKLSLK